MKSTLDIFKRLRDRLPPLFPTHTADKMRQVIGHIENDPSATLDDIENTMVVFGYELWAYSRAYHEFYSSIEDQMAEEFLLSHLSPEMRDRYREFKIYGGNWRDLHSGGAAKFFSQHDLSELARSLVDTRQVLRQYSEREAVGVKRAKYLKSVARYQNILEEIKIKLDELRRFADAEIDHPQLASEVRERVRLFEHGLCDLAPSMDPEAVRQSVDFFAGRRRELSRLRGLHIPLEINFYA
ncbi:MAG: hypothetical protein WCT40_04455 [Candidatus Magasanikbacteria bacterium]|jgi:hypothetical protein